MSGLGLTVGVKAIAGNFGYHYQNGKLKARRFQDIRPFPLGLVETHLSPIALSPSQSLYGGSSLSRAELFSRHPQSQIKRVGACILIGGWKKKEQGVVIDAPGIVKEYQLAYDAGIVPLAIGSSVGMAKTGCLPFVNSACFRVSL